MRRRVAAQLVVGLAVLLAAAPARAIVAGDPAGSPPDSPSNRVDPNTTSSPFAGLGSLQLIHPVFGTFICSGAPISRWHVLTAAHCLDLDDDGIIDLTPANVRFQLNFGGIFSHVIVGSHLEIHPDFTGFGNPVPNDDLGIITLETSVPPEIPIYPIHTTPIVAGTVLTLAGYGRSGDGVNGYTTNASFTVKRSGQNTVDDFGPDDEGGGALELFRYDFDGPTGNHSGGPTLGNDVETTIGGGDSGPAFVSVGGSLRVAGVSNNTFRFGPPFGPENPNAPFFGSGGGGVLVAPYSEWIEGIVSDLDLDSLPDGIDPCPLYPNTLPLNGGGGCGSPPADPNADCNGDGIPNECQCGDTEQNGVLNGFDSLAQLQCGAFPLTCAQGPPVVDLWDANGDQVLNGFDSIATLINGGSVTEYLNRCVRRPGRCALDAIDLCLIDNDCSEGSTGPCEGQP